MNHLLSKNQVNNQKSWLINEKSAKFAPSFIQNKANSKNIKIGLSPFKTTEYENLPAWRGKKQTQFKPNSNPIAKMPKMNVNICYTKEYKNETFFPAPKTKPKQSQNKPNTNLSSNVVVGEPIQTGLPLKNSRKYKYYLTLPLEAGRIPSDTEVIFCNCTNEKGFQTCL